MTARSMIARALVAALGLLGARALPARAVATDSVLVRVGGSLAAQNGEYIDIPVSADLSAAPGRRLGGYRIRFNYDQTRLQFADVTGGSFADPLYNTDSTNFGLVKVTALLPAGATGSIVLFIVRMYVTDDTAPTPVSVTVEDLTAASSSVTPFEDLLPLVRVVNATFCRSMGRWGDVDFDARATSRDALIALSTVVGIAPTDTLIVPALADVDGDGNVTSRDALIILSSAVGLPVPGFRVLLAASTCGGVAASTLVVLPDTLEIEEGQSAYVALLARDGLGRTVNADHVTWFVTDATIAGVTADGSMGYVTGRDPGITRLTAELGPGVRGQLVVIVIQRRRVWYVDVQRSRMAVTRTGGTRFPFEFIGDAVDIARDGDTIHVAGGIYEEVISDYKAVTILGDSTNRAIIDPRGSPYPNETAIYFGDTQGRIELAHLVLRYGGIELRSAHSVVRNVRMEQPVRYQALEIDPDYYEDLRMPAGVSSVAAFDGSTALIDNVEIVQYQGSGGGVYIRDVDSAVVRNSVVSGDSTRESCYSEGGEDAAINVEYVDYTRITDNVVSGSRCQGIGAYAIDRAIVSRNVISHIGSAGIAASARIVATDHNRIRDVGADSSYFYYVYGINVNNQEDVDSATSVADSIVDLRGEDPIGYRSYVEATAVIDSIVIDSVGLNSVSYSGHGVFAERDDGRLSVSNSRISRVRGSGIITESRLRSVASRNNRFVSIGESAVLVSWNCDCSDLAIDSVTSVRDSATGVSWAGVQVTNTQWVRVDSADFTGAYGDYVGGVHVDAVGQVMVRHSSIREFDGGVSVYNSAAAILRGNTFTADSNGAFLYSVSDSVVVVGNTVDSSGIDGLYADYAGSARFDSNVVRNSAGVGIAVRDAGNAVSVRGNTVDSSGVWGIAVLTSGGSTVARNTVTRSQNTGILLQTLSDTAFVTGNRVDDGMADGIFVEAAPFHGDSNRVKNNALSGLVFSNGAGGIATRHRLENNGNAGVFIYSDAVSASVVLTNNILAGNLSGINNTNAGYTSVDALNNYWGDSRGPRCDSTVTGTACDPASLGDSVVTAGVTFTPYLASAPGGVPASPPLSGLVAARSSASAVRAAVVRTSHARRTQQALPPTRPAVRPRRPEPARVAAPARPPRQPVPITWRKGRPARS